MRLAHKTHKRRENFHEFKSSHVQIFAFHGSYFCVLVVGCENREIRTSQSFPAIRYQHITTEIDSNRIMYVYLICICYSRRHLILKSKIGTIGRCLIIMGQVEQVYSEEHKRLSEMGDRTCIYNIHTQNMMLMRESLLPSVCEKPGLSVMHTLDARQL